MKPRNRDINIFNLSMLDVISGALGAFIIIMIVLFPYYKKETIDYQVIIQTLRADLQTIQQQLQQAQESSQRAQAEAQQARQEAQEAQQQAENLRQQLAKTFLVVYITWKTGQDVDLHVIDPSGAEFYWDTKTHSGRPGELSEDNVEGPGAEVWEIRDAPPGAYRIYFNLYSAKGINRAPEVRGRVFYRDGSSPLPETRLTRVGDKKLVATVNVQPDGSVEFRTDAS